MTPRQKAIVHARLQRITQNTQRLIRINIALMVLVTLLSVVGYIVIIVNP